MDRRKYVTVADLHYRFRHVPSGTRLDSSLFDGVTASWIAAAIGRGIVRLDTHSPGDDVPSSPEPSTDSEPQPEPVDRKPSRRRTSR